MSYQGPPKYAEQPLGLDELAHGHHAPSPEDLEGFEVGEPIVLPESVGPLPTVDRIDDIPGAAGLRPFPDKDSCDVQVVHHYPERYPNVEVAQKGAQFFSQWGDRTGGTSGTELRVETPSQWSSHRMVRSPMVPGGGSALWLIDLWGYEVIRTPTAQEGPLTPLGSNEIISTGGQSPVLQAGRASTKLKARIMWWASSGGTTRIVDIGQGCRCALEASLVTVEVLFPSPGTVQVKQTDIGDIPNPPVLGAAGGTILDTVVGCSITPTTSTPGQQIMTNTMIVQPLQAEADLEVLVPPGSRSVSAYQSSAGSVMTPAWRFGREPGFPLAELGLIDLGASRRVDTIARPGAAGMITTGPADPLFDRLATFVFELEL